MKHTPDASSRPASLAAWLFATQAGVVYVFLYAPIVVLVVLSFNAAERGAAWKGGTLRWYREMLADPQLREGTVNSLIVASIATGVSTVVGTMAALALDRYRPRRRSGAAAALVTRGLLYLPIIVPEIVLGVSLLTLFSELRVYLSLGTVILAHIVFTVSYVAVVVKARLAGLDRSLEEAAMDLGAGPAGTFFRITLPQVLPGIAAGALLAFTLSLDDYVVTSLVAGVGSETLPMRIWPMLGRSTVRPTVNAVSASLLLFTMGLIILANWLLRERPRERNRSEGQNA